MEIAYVLAYGPRLTSGPSTTATTQTTNDVDSQHVTFPPGVFDDDSGCCAFSTLSTTAISADSSTWSPRDGVRLSGFSVSPASDVEAATSGSASPPSYRLSSDDGQQQSSNDAVHQVDGRPTHATAARVRFGHHRHHRHQQRRRRRGRHSSADGETSDERASPRRRCCGNKRCGECCAKCLIVITSLRFILVTIVLTGTGAVVVGIALGALNMVVGNSFLSLSLLFIGLGVIVIVIVGVVWRCVPANNEPCHRLLRIDQRPAEVYNSGTGFGGDVTAAGGNGFRFLHGSRNQQWGGGIIYPEFHYNAPPPAYDVALHDQRSSYDMTSLTPASLSIVQSSYAVEFDAADSISLPASTPPSYRSRASSCRSYLSATAAGRPPGATGGMQSASADDSRGNDAPPPEYDTWRRTVPHLAVDGGTAAHPWDGEDVAAVAAASAAEAPDATLMPVSSRGSISSMSIAGVEAATAAIDPLSSSSSSKFVTAEDASSRPPDACPLSERQCHVRPPSCEQLDGSSAVDVTSSSPSPLTTDRPANVSETSPQDFRDSAESPSLKVCDASPKFQRLEQSDLGQNFDGGRL